MGTEKMEAMTGTKRPAGAFFLLPLLLAFFSEATAFPQDASVDVTSRYAKAPFYSTLKDWKRVASIDEQIQKQFVLHMEKLGYRDRLKLLKIETPQGNVVPELKGSAMPLTGLVVTHSMDGDPGRKNNIAKYLSQGYDSIGVDKLGVVYVRGTSFLRTHEEFVPNLTTINITFDVNAEEGERVNPAQAETAADIAEALQRALSDLGTGVKVYFLDHHEKGLKNGKNYLEAGPARDAANQRLKSLSQ